MAGEVMPTEIPSETVPRRHLSNWEITFVILGLIAFLLLLMGAIFYKVRQLKRSRGALKELVPPKTIGEFSRRQAGVGQNSNWRKVVVATNNKILIDAMKDLYPSGENVEIEKVLSYVLGSRMTYQERNEICNSLARESNGRLTLFDVRVGDRWIERIMQTEDLRIPPAAFVSKVLACGLKVDTSQQVIVKAIVELESKTR